jgi:hypothetical protein
MRNPVFMLHEKSCSHPPFSVLHPICLKSARAIEAAFLDQPASSLWIAQQPDPLLRVLLPLASRRRGLRLLVLGSANTAKREALHRLFNTVVTKDVDARFLPDNELAEVLAAENHADLFIGGAADEGAGTLVLYRGDLTPLVVPLSMFKARPGSPRPDAGRLEIVDYGQTVRLGDFEASADSILYEQDADYRRKAKARLVEQDDSFGGSLKRLRLQKGLSRSDFGNISAKEVARIERGQIKRPRPPTLRKIAAKLGVAVDALGTF